MEKNQKYSGFEDHLDCPVNIARSSVLLVNGAFESSKKVHLIPKEYILERESDGERARHIRDIDAIIDAAFDSKKLFSELEVRWAKDTPYFDMRDYACFPRVFYSKMVKS